MGYCGSIGMISTLKKMHQEVCNCHFEILAERAKKHLKKFTKIHIYFVIEDADLNDKKIGRTSGPIC